MSRSEKITGMDCDNEGKAITNTPFQLKFKKGDIITITQKEDGEFKETFIFIFFREKKLEHN